jgi:hypothetical protein
MFGTIIVETTKISKMRNFLKIGLAGMMICLLAFPVLASGDSDFDNGQNQVSLEVFPNPVIGNEFTITSNLEIAQVSVINILGQQVFEQQYVGETKINIELEIRERGVYLLQVKTFDGRVMTKRILFK